MTQGRFSVGHLRKDLQMVGNKMRTCPSTDLQEWLPVREADDVPIPKKKKKKKIAPGQEDQLVLERLGRPAQPVPDGLSR